MSDCNIGNLFPLVSQALVVNGSHFRAPHRAVYDATKRELLAMADRALATETKEAMLNVVREYTGKCCKGCTVLLVQHDTDSQEIVQVR